MVRMYQKYKNKGFDILSVSLDRDKNRWVQAIESDNMTWHHVSDLKGWQSVPAAQYGVMAIPANFLIDGDGIIVARGLRGEYLDNKLKELLK